MSGKRNSDLRFEAVIWATRGLLLFGVWALSTLYGQITGKIAELDQRINVMASSLARVETLLEKK